MSRQSELAAGIRHVLQLRQAEAIVEPDVRMAIAEAREFIEEGLGSTVRPATAARLLGVSQTALTRWLERREIASVLTAAGRREIPLAELLDLLEEAERLDVTEASRPLAAVLRERRRKAEESVDIERLLPRRRARTHRVPELHALAYHRLIAERLEESTVEQARRRLARWKAAGRIHPRWASEWEEVLAQPLPRIARTISADTQHARELRQSSPFAGELNEHERRRLVEAVERRASG
jgi:predicted transcriptional regulator